MSYKDAIKLSPTATLEEIRSSERYRLLREWWQERAAASPQEVVNTPNSMTLFTQLTGMPGAIWHLCRANWDQLQPEVSAYFKVLYPQKSGRRPKNKVHRASNAERASGSAVAGSTSSPDDHYLVPDPRGSSTSGNPIRFMPTEETMRKKREAKRKKREEDDAKEPGAEDEGRVTAKKRHMNQTKEQGISGNQGQVKEKKRQGREKRGKSPKGKPSQITTSMSVPSVGPFRDPTAATSSTPPAGVSSFDSPYSSGHGSSFGGSTPSSISPFEHFRHLSDSPLDERRRLNPQYMTIPDRPEQSQVQTSGSAWRQDVPGYAWQGLPPDQSSSALGLYDGDFLPGESYGTTFVHRQPSVTESPSDLLARLDLDEFPPSAVTDRWSPLISPAEAATSLGTTDRSRFSLYATQLPVDAFHAPMPQFDEPYNDPQFIPDPSLAVDPMFVMDPRFTDEDRLMMQAVVEPVIREEFDPWEATPASG